MIEVYYVEDDENIARMVKDDLEQRGFERYCFGFSKRR